MTWLDELQEKAEKATPGPWFFDGVVRVMSDMEIDASSNCVRYGGSIAHVPVNGKQEMENARFIAAASPETVKRLIRIARAAMAFIHPYPDLIAEGESFDEARDLELALKGDLEEALREGGVG